MMNLPHIDFEDVKQLEANIQFFRRLLVKLSGAPQVLVVEDNESDFFLLSRQLIKFQCSVIRARDGEEAVNLIKAHKFDIIFMDQAMPKLTGGEVLEQTINWRKDARVVMITGFLNSPCIPKTLEKGAVMAFAKPINEEVLDLFLTRV